MSLFATLTEDGSYSLTGAGYTVLIVLMLGVLLLACFLAKADEKVKGTRRLVFSAMAIALAFVTSFIKVWEMPMGGSITLFSMFFITLIGYWYGLSTGIMAAIAYGLLQLIADPYIISVPQMLCDYILAFGALGLSGLFSRSKNGLIKGYITGVLGRYFFAFLSGYIFFGMYAPDSFELFGANIPLNPVTYSLLYNGFYLIPEAVITIVVFLLPPVAAAVKKVKNMAVEQELQCAK